MTTALYTLGAFSTLLAGPVMALLLIMAGQSLLRSLRRRNSSSTRELAGALNTGTAQDGCSLHPDGQCFVSSAKSTQAA